MLARQTKVNGQKAESQENPENLMEMFLTTDESSKRDFRQVVAINETAANFQLYDYVLIKDIVDNQENGGQIQDTGEASPDSGAKEKKKEPLQWIGQITAPNLNISPVGGPYDPTILHAIKLRRTKPGVKLAETIESWQITLLGEYKKGKLNTLRRRPKPGASVARLGEEQTLNVLNIAQYNYSKPNAIGYLINAEAVPLCVDRTIFTHHILVSGGTGSGKSNTAANLIRQAAKQGFFVFLYDAKPDYRKLQDANSDPRIEPELWQSFKDYGIKPEGANDVLRIAIYNGKRDYGKYDLVIGFRASDFEPYVFADLFFDESANINQYEEFASVCADLKDNGDGDTEDDRIFELKKVEQEVLDRWNAFNEEEKSQQGQTHKKQSEAAPGRPVIHPKTAEAILRKVRRLKKNMLCLVTLHI